MATPYETIYTRFENKISDFNLPELDDDTLGDMLSNWLMSAIAKCRQVEHDLTNRDDDFQEFTDDLTDFEVEVLALYMVDSWLGQYLNSTELVLQFIGGKEEKIYSQASHISELRALRDQNLLEINRMFNYHTYTHSSYFDS